METERALRKSEEQHRIILKSALDGFLLVNSSFRLVEVNDAYCSMSGYSREELLSRPVMDLFPKRNHLKARLERIFSTGSGRFETILQRKDGNSVYLEISVNFLPEQEGLFFAFLHDISERKHAEAVLHAEKELAHVTLESIGDGVITTDASGCVSYLNPIAENLTGWKSGEACGMKLSLIYNIVNEETGEIMGNPVETALKEERIVGVANHAVLIGKEGKRFAIEDSAAPIRSRDGKIIGVVLVFHDVSEKRQLLQRILWQAGHDALTSLPNRALLQDRLTQAMAASARNERLLAVLFLDLDGFKEINDQFGHPAGDMLLKEIATRLSSCLRA
ncbi:MAG TPA: PAS domain S-box protein, partial [Burkholderiales bacterium]|nr:PAS domain S-box protein [Burkholderiales bacterium]